MTSKEYIKEHLKSLRKDFDIAIKNNLKDYANKLVEEIKCSENILKDLEQKEKQDKVLEILKTKRIDIYYLSTCLYEDEEKGCKDYSGYDSEDDLTIEEFKLLKEWLNNDK